MLVGSLRPTFNHDGDKFLEEGLFVFTEDCGPSHLGPLPNTHNCMEVGRPTLDSTKGPVEVGRPTVKDSSGVRAYGGCRAVVCGCPEGVNFDFQQGSSPPAPNTKVLTDEALMEEASRYTVSLSRAFFSLGKRNFSSSSSLSRRDGMLVATDGDCGRDCRSEIVGGVDLGPLRMIMVYGREAEVLGVG